MWWNLLAAAGGIGLGWWLKSHFGGLGAIEEAIISEYRRFGSITVTSPNTGQQVQAIPTAHASDPFSKR